jgi:hypothetical protein
MGGGGPGGTLFKFDFRHGGQLADIFIREIVEFEGFSFLYLLFLLFLDYIIVSKA